MKQSHEPFHILIAEDDEDHAELLLYKLKSIETKTNPHFVHDGAEILQYLKNRNNPLPKLVILDLNMPKLSGLEVLEKIKSSESLFHIPVIILTTSDAKQDRIKAFKLSANSFLTKPMDFEDLSTMLTDLIRYWSLWHQSLSQSEYLELQEKENNK
ncbi:MAG: response regulator [Verrucomicrobiota bacterium]